MSLKEQPFLNDLPDCRSSATFRNTAFVRESPMNFIEHTNLKPASTAHDIRLLCAQAIEYGFLGVCVNPVFIPLAREILSDNNIKIVSVVGFPLGANTVQIKAAEAAQAIKNGADEIDMVISVGALKGANYFAVFEDIRTVVKASEGHVVKVIIETALLSNEEKTQACLIAQRAGASFVKTSSGFAVSGATVGDVFLMRKTVGSQMGIKAAGGIKDFETMRALVEAGADRIGASSSIAIIEEWKNER